MLVIHKSAREQFDTAKIKARLCGLTKQFANVLNQLRTYGCSGKGSPEVRVFLFKDFAPHSFSIVWKRLNKENEWSIWFQGGLIFHGPHDNGGDGSAPTFSVNLTPMNGWSVHT